MKTLHVIIFACLLGVNVFGQNQILKEYDFKSNQYTLIGFPLFEYDAPTIADSIGEFYIKDSKILSKIQVEWIVEKSLKEHNRTTYLVDICKDGIVLESFFLDQVNSIIHTDEGDFSFNDTLFTQFIKDFKKPVKREYKFDSISNARNELLRIKKNSKLILATGRWIEFEGEFSIDYPNVDNEMSVEDYLSKVEVIIKKKYKDEPFSLYWIGDGMEDEVQLIGIKCNKSLFNKLELKDIYKNNWESFDLHLSTWETE